MRASAGAGVLIVLAACRSPGAPPTPSLEAVLADYGAFGYSGVVLVSRGDRQLLHAAVGSANDDTGLPFSVETRFDIGSLAKSFTGAAVLRAMELGLLELDDPVAGHLPEVGGVLGEATVEGLLQHTAGLPAYLPGVDPGDEVSRSEFRSRLGGLALETPGTFRYSDVGYDLLALLLETVTGTDLGTFFRRELFEPAGLTSTTFYGDLPDTVPMAVGYETEGAFGRGVADVREWPASWHARGSGGMVSTTGDLRRWFDALHQGRVLRGSGRSTLFDPTRAAVVRDGVRYGFGWFLESDSLLGEIIHHGGAYVGHTADVRFYTRDSTLIVTAANRRPSGFATALLMSRIVVPPLLYGSISGDPPPPEVSARSWADPSPDLLGSWPIDGASGRFVLELAEGRLWVSAEGQGAATFLAGGLVEPDSVVDRWNAESASLLRRAATAPDSVAPEHRFMVDELRGLERRHGDLVDLEVLGTAPAGFALDRRLGETFVRLRFERGRETYRVVRSGGTIVGSDWGIERPARTPCVVLDPDRVACFSLRLRVPWILSLERHADGLRLRAVSQVDSRTVARR